MRSRARRCGTGLTFAPTTTQVSQRIADRAMAYRARHSLPSRMPVDKLEAPGSVSTPAGGSARRARLTLAVVVLALTWGAAVGIGMQRIWAYETTAGSALPSPRQWPGSELVSLQPGKATLIMFVHPRCTCTAASLAEMQTIVAQAARPVAPWVLLLRPAGTGEDWAGASVNELVQRIPNARLLTDSNGVEAARFGAETSGHVVAYDPAGHLLYSGGITGKRGHAGDNVGRRTLLAALNGTAVATAGNPVLGCGFHDPDPRPQ